MGAVCDRQDDGFDFSEMQDLEAFLLLNWLSTIFMFSHSSIWDWVVSLRSSLRLRDFESLFLELLGTTELLLLSTSILFLVCVLFLFYLLFMDLLKLEYPGSPGRVRSAARLSNRSSPNAGCVQPKRRERWKPRSLSRVKGAKGLMSSNGLKHLNASIVATLTFDCGVVLTQGRRHGTQCRPCTVEAERHAHQLRVSTVQFLQHTQSLRLWLLKHLKR